MIKMWNNAYYNIIINNIINKLFLSMHLLILHHNNFTNIFLS